MAPRPPWDDGRVDRPMRPLLRALAALGLRTIASCAGHECYQRRGDQKPACTEQGFVAIHLKGVQVSIHDGVLWLRWESPGQRRGPKKHLRREDGHSAYRTRSGRLTWEAT